MFRVPDIPSKSFSHLAAKSCHNIVADDDIRAASNDLRRNEGNTCLRISSAYLRHFLSIF